jgi:hypothetical protein
VKINWPKIIANPSATRSSSNINDSYRLWSFCRPPTRIRRR